MSTNSYERATQKGNRICIVRLIVQARATIVHAARINVRGDVDRRSVRSTRARIGRSVFRESIQPRLSVHITGLELQGSSIVDGCLVAVTGPFECARKPEMACRAVRIKIDGAA